MEKGKKAMKAKKVPQRRCISCRNQLPKRELLRIVRTPEQKLLYDPRGKMSGRGAYLCGKPACLEKAVKHKLFRRHLEVDLDEELMKVLEGLCTDSERST